MLSVNGGKTAVVNGMAVLEVSFLLCTGSGANTMLGKAGGPLSSTQQIRSRETGGKLKTLAHTTANVGPNWNWKAAKLTWIVNTPRGVKPQA